MKAAKEKQKTLKKPKSITSTALARVSKEIKPLPQRVFLYLHVNSITFCPDGLAPERAEIELHHQYNTITTLSDHYMPRNIIHLDQFAIVKPTFSITIEQDSIDDITILSDCPIMLTLYIYVEKKISNVSETLRNSVSEEESPEEIRIPVAQGHIDIVQYFDKKRVRSSDTVFLYPLKSFGPTMTCKTEWEIYSLHPLLKSTVLSNFLFITLGGLYNIKEELMDDCPNLGANLSFISKMPNEYNEYDKIFICKFKNFTKSIVSEQNLAKSWETLKSVEFENINTMGIASESNIIINQLFSNLLSTDNVEFNFFNIKITEEFVLVCNSMHRYVLTDNMTKILENTLSGNRYHIIVEIYSELNTNTILLQGFMDLSIFMYPDVNNCSFAIELKSPTKEPLKSDKTKGKGKKAFISKEKLTTDEKIPFAIIQMCLFAPITYPCQDILNISTRKPKHNKFCQYTATLANNPTASTPLIPDQKYKDFDDLILEIMDYIVINKIRKMEDDKEFFRHQLSNMSNKIMKIVASDFNIKTPTKTNIEFTNLITTVYRDMISRVYEYIKKCSPNGLQNCVFTVTKVQLFILETMSSAKYLYEVGNIEMADTLMDFLRAEYPNNLMLKFYLFLYELEKQNFEEVVKYLKLPLDEKNTEGALFESLIKIYVNYKLQLEDPEQSETAEENLIQDLREYCLTHKPISITAFIVLYCLYKRNNYEPGIEYCRWHYENLYESTFRKLEFIPTSRWEIYMPHKINIKSLKGQYFRRVCEKLLRLGLYKFAQWVFDDIANECIEVEKYFFSSTFMIFENQLPDNLSITTFAVDKLIDPTQGRATLSLVNGNLEHYRATNNLASIKQYQAIAELQDLVNYCPYQLGLLRYAYVMLEEKNFEEAAQVFLNLCNNKENIVSTVGRGKACYYLNQLDEAEKYFALSTAHGVYIPYAWAFLALINLKKDNNYNALECWKYSKLNKNYITHEEIINELQKINYSDVFLYVDVPNKI